MDWALMATPVAAILYVAAFHDQVKEWLVWLTAVFS